MTENNQQKEEGDIDKILKEPKDMDINFEKIINEGERQNKNDGFEILKKKKMILHIYYQKLMLELYHQK